MFTPKAISSDKELPDGWFMSGNSKDPGGVARLLLEFVDRFGEPDEGYVWTTDNFYHVYLRNRKVQS